MDISVFTQYISLKQNLFDRVNFRFFASLELPTQHFRPCVAVKKTDGDRERIVLLLLGSFVYHFHMTQLPDQYFSLLCKHARCIVFINNSTPNVLLGPLWDNKHTKLITCLNLHLQKLDVVMNIILHCVPILLCHIKYWCDTCHVRKCRRMTLSICRDSAEHCTTLHVWGNGCMCD